MCWETPNGEEGWGDLPVAGQETQESLVEGGVDVVE